jgi:predicted acylesterase/phospholipase RssA/CRP-like cAMP-binding protein
VVDELAAFLGRFPMFARLDDEQRRALAARVRLVNVPAGRWAFRQGEHAQGQYLVRSGRLELWKDDTLALGSVAVGASLGEVSLLAGEPHAASALARRDTELVLIERSVFLDLTTQSRAFSAALLDDLGHMLAASGTFARVKPRTKRSVLALVPIGRDVSVARVRDGLVARLAEWGPTTLWSARDFAVAPTEDDFPELGRRLDELERVHEFVVLETDPSVTPTPWTVFCTRQADRILGVAGDEPAPPASFEGSRSMLRGCELVFAEPASPEIRCGWLDRLIPRTHYNLPSPEKLADTIAVLSRRVTGRSIGLVLSGGGARGLAHIGAIRGLLDAGVTIDRIGGTSMGAFVGSLFAAGHAPEEIVEICRRELVDRKPFNDFSVPVVSLARGRRAQAMMHRVFGNANIEDLHLDFFCITADLASGEAVVHRRGSVIDAVGASMSIPGWAPPIRIGERVLVDGGVLNNFPVGVMTAADEGPVIGVDAMASSNLVGPAQQARGLPNIMETLGGAATLGSRRLAQASAEEAALVIRPDVGGIGLIDFGHIDRLFEIGRRTAMEAVASAPNSDLRAPTSSV